MVDGNSKHWPFSHSPAGSVSNAQDIPMGSGLSLLAEEELQQLTATLIKVTDGFRKNLNEDDLRRLDVSEDAIQLYRINMARLTGQFPSMEDQGDSHSVHVVTHPGRALQLDARLHTGGSSLYSSVGDFRPVTTESNMYTDLSPPASSPSAIRDYFTKPSMLNLNSVGPTRRNSIASTHYPSSDLLNGSPGLTIRGVSPIRRPMSYHVDLLDASSKFKNRLSSANTLRPDAQIPQLPNRSPLRPNSTQVSQKRISRLRPPSVDLLAATKPDGTMKRAPPSPINVGISWDQRARDAPDRAPRTPVTPDTMSSYTPSAIQYGGHTYVRQRTPTSTIMTPTTTQFSKHLLSRPATFQLEDPAERPETGIAQEICILFVLVMVPFLSMAALAQAMILGRTIGSTLGQAEPQYTSWLSAAYVMTAGVFMLPASRLGDVFGQRGLLILGFTLSGLSSIVSGFASLIDGGEATSLVSYTFFCTFRGIQGIGVALMVPNAHVLMFNLYASGPRRRVITTIFNMGTPLGLGLGGIVAALFGQYTSWAWAFWLQGATSIVACLVAYLAIPGSNGSDQIREEWPSTDPNPPKCKLWEVFNGPGLVAMLTGSLLVGFALSQGPVAGWDTGYVIFFLAFGLLLLGVAAVLEIRAVHRLVPRPAEPTRTIFTLAVVAGCWGSFAVWASSTVRFLQLPRSMSLLLSSLALSPGGIMGVAACIVVAYLRRRLRSPYIYLIGAITVVLGDLLMVLAQTDQGYYGNTLISVLLVFTSVSMVGPAALATLGETGLGHAAMVNWVAYFAMAIALGLGATVESMALEQDSTDDSHRRLSANPIIPPSFRGLQEVAVGFAGLGFVAAVAAVLVQSSDEMPHGEDNSTYVCNATGDDEESEKGRRTGRGRREDKKGIADMPGSPGVSVVPVMPMVKVG